MTTPDDEEQDDIDWDPVYDHDEPIIKRTPIYELPPFARGEYGDQYL